MDKWLFSQVVRSVSCKLQRVFKRIFSWVFLNVSDVLQSNYLEVKYMTQENQEVLRKQRKSQNTKIQKPVNRTATGAWLPQRVSQTNQTPTAEVFCIFHGPRSLVGGWGVNGFTLHPSYLTFNISYSFHNKINEASDEAWIHQRAWKQARANSNSYKELF